MWGVRVYMCVHYYVHSCVHVYNYVICSVCVHAILRDENHACIHKNYAH